MDPDPALGTLDPKWKYTLDASSLQTQTYTPTGNFIFGNPPTDMVLGASEMKNVEEIHIDTSRTYTETPYLNSYLPGGANKTACIYRQTVCNN